MDKNFYRKENARIKEKNYVYYAIIGILWAFNFILVCTRYRTTVPHFSELHAYSFFQFFGVLTLMKRLCDNLFYVREMGEKSSRLKKYECTPLLKKQCCAAYALILGRYTAILSAGSLVIFFAVTTLLHTLRLQPLTGWGLVTFLLLSAAAYLWILILNIRKSCG
ncbi:hypothetical protein NXH76_10880 [Blautia schinkii]|nr:hypothetical protein [Blautia schinkii]